MYLHINPAFKWTRKEAFKHNQKKRFGLLVSGKDKIEVEGDTISQTLLELYHHKNSSILLDLRKSQACVMEIYPYTFLQKVIYAMSKKK